MTPGGMDLYRTLDTLIDHWCERRALRPLQRLLREYPGVFAHTDQKFALLHALKDVRDLCRKDLTAEECVWVGQLCRLMEEALSGALR